MAPFKFKKKILKDKKQSDSDSTSPSLTSTPSKGTSISTFQGYFHQQQQQQQHQAPPQQQQKQHYNHQQPQQQQEQRAPRVYPTPPPIQQRNVSGAATALPQHQREYTPWNRVKLQDSPFPRYRHVASSYISADMRIYVIGGLHDESVYGDTWIITANENGTHFTSKTVDISDATPPPRVGHAATLCGNAFVLFGGDTHKVNSEGLMDDDIYLFNINSYKWTVPHPVGPRPLGRYGHKISIIATNQMKTKLYLFGGQFDDTYFNDLAFYDLSSFRRPDSHWEFLKPETFVPPPLTNHTMVSYDHKLWVFGGDTLQGLINEIFMFDLAINDWALIETTGSKPPPLQEHAAVVYKDLMCVVGGKDEQDVYMNSVYFFNFKSYRWFKLPIFKAGIPQGRSGHSVTLLKNDKILIMGGDKFDYARQGEYDLNTSDTDMGKGTLLYTLDLSRLEELCPDILKSAGDPIAFNPTTPPINNSIAPNRGPQPQPNILTPYVHDVPETPIIKKTLSQNGDASNVKIPEYEEHDESDTIIKEEAVDLPSRSSHRQISNITKPVSPVPALSLSRSEQAHVPRVVSLSSEHNTVPDNTEDEVGVATLASSPLKGDVKYDASSQQAEPEHKEIPYQTSLSEPAGITKSNEPPHAEANEIPSRLKTAVGTDSADAVATPLKETVDRNVVHQLRSQLEELKLVTENKALMASDHIRELESQVEKLSSATPRDTKNVNIIKLQSHCDVLEADRNIMQERIHELEKILGSRFLEAETFNMILKEQNTKIHELESQPAFKDKFSELEEKFESLVKENAELHSKLEAVNSGYKGDIHKYTLQLDELISQWQKNKSIELDEANGHEDTTGSPYVLGTRHHQAAISKLQKRLDELLKSSEALAESRDKLSSEYRELEMKHSSLSQDLLAKQNELEKSEVNYKDTLTSATNSHRALDMSQSELEKFKQANKRLQEELDELRYAHDSSNGEVSVTSSNIIPSGSAGNSTSGQEANVKYARYNMKINDLKAELYIIGQERDNLKEEVLQLKKKQLIMDNE